MTTLAQFTNRPCIPCGVDRLHKGLTCDECGHVTVFKPFEFKFMNRLRPPGMSPEDARIRKNELRRARRQAGSGE